MVNLRDNEAARRVPSSPCIRKSTNPRFRVRSARGVSRRYETLVEGNEWRWWRNASDFSQQFVGTISEDRQTIVSHGEYSRNGGAWNSDLALTYRRVD